MRLVAPRRTVRQHVVDVWAYRELLLQLVRRELKVKYKNSILGFVWSLLNPAFTAGIYYLVFVVFLPNGVPQFHIWLLAGLLLWQFFSTSLVGGTMSVTGNAFLVGKVRFPREVLPLSAVGAALVHLVLQLGVLFAIVAASRFPMDWAWAPMAVAAIITCVVLAAALAILLSAVNVYARDTQHLLEVFLQIWFWLSVIIVPYVSIGAQLDKRGITPNMQLLNPVVPLVLAMQRFIYGRKGLPGHVAKSPAGFLPDGSWLWYLRGVGVVALLSVALLWFSIRVFDRSEGNFAEVL
ncbi:MAG: type transporter [Acidimicrobiia bacterium]|nr:type transporter [Acidimicrobiia bacterium]